MKNNCYAPKKTALRRLAAAALAFALCLCALPVTVFAEDTPSRPQSDWIRAEEVTCQVKKDLTEKASKYVKVAKNGKVTVKKGTKKGTYRLSVDITAKGDKTYAKTTKTAALTVTVK